MASMCPQGFLTISRSPCSVVQAQPGELLSASPANPLRRPSTANGRVLLRLQRPTAQRTHLVCCSAINRAALAAKRAAAAAAAGAASTAAGSAISLETVSVMIAGSYSVLLFALMILAPRAHRVQRFMGSLWLFLPVTLLYGALLINAWTPDTLNTLLPGSLQAGLSAGQFSPQFFPRLEGIQALFSRHLTASSWLVHVLVINLFLGRYIYLDGLRRLLPTAHSLVLTVVFGPLGLLSHLLTKAYREHTTKPPQGLSSSASADEMPLVLKSGEGFISMLPYSER